MRNTLLAISLLLLTLVEIARVYFIMPFPGSQQGNTVQLAYWLDQHIHWIRGFGIAVVVILFLGKRPQLTRWSGALLVVLALFYAVVFYLFNFKFLAEKMFYQPVVKSFLPAAVSTVDSEKLVLGVTLNGESKAYPIQYIGYHHQVRDSIGNTPVMITYCTVCRTGRVFRPLVNGHTETFRLVGMDHFNAMFEDSTTHSWWRQVSGEAITGPLKGQKLEEIPSQQMRLSAWLRQFPASTILQADTGFNAKYEKLAKYDRGNVSSALEKRDSGSWQPKSWVVGVSVKNAAKAYDWNTLLQQKLIQDSFAAQPLLVTLDADTSSFYVLDRTVGDQVLQFRQTEPGWLTDVQTGSRWSADGLCIAGALQQRRLKPLSASQEFWHSWQTFHPNTIK